MLKRILVPLDNSDYTQAATRMAAHIASRDGSRGEKGTVVGLGIVDLDQIPTGRFANIVPRDELVREAEQNVAGLVQAFQEQARALGLDAAHVETRSVSGSPFREIIRESVFADIIVMGERCSYPPVHHDYDTMHNLYHSASRPIILTEATFEAVDTVVMAMDGTAPASRMLYTYLHLNPFPRARVVLTYSRQEQADYGLGDFFERVEGCLQTFGHSVRTEPMDGDFEKNVIDLVNREGAQVLTLGAHREHFLGRLADPLHIRENFAHRLLRHMSASLLVVN